MGIVCKGGELSAGQRLSRRQDTFATDEHLRRLPEADIVFVDGTFQTCPRLFYRFFTIHAILNGRHIPLVYCLLPNKRQETYKRVFHLLEEKVRVDLQLELLPTTVMSDYELVIT